MRKINRIFWPGILALAVSGAVFAHSPGGHGVYPDSGWAGNATVWVNPIGNAAFAGTLSYGVGYGYASGYAPWLAQGHGPQCRHGRGYGHGRGHRHGYKKERKHRRKHKGHHH